MTRQTHVSCQIADDRATLLLQPPEGKPPTIDGNVLDELEQRIGQIKEQQPRIVLLKSASERFFCVGANIDVLRKTSEQTIVPWVMHGHRILNLIEDLPMPVVAVIDGYVMGGGLELAMACDLIFASDRAQLAQSEAGLGFIPGWGGTRRLTARVGLGQAKYWFYSGKMLDAKTADAIGLVDVVSASEQLDETVNAFADTVIANNANAIARFKHILNDSFNEARMANASAEAFHSISCLRDADTRQRLNDFLAKREKKD